MVILAMPVYDELYKFKLHHVLVHEQGATHAAQGYARALKVGVAIATSGPVNKLNPELPDAQIDSTCGLYYGAGRKTFVGF
jgi:acetolactate synthase-1/2/3 large subunit